eukprot:Skav220902  [mRNA]  locus=scaffold3880:230679:231680:+ [translate_table: standard]
MQPQERPETLMKFLPELSNASRSSIVYFGGHRHNVDQRSVASIGKHTSWLSGGGGGQFPGMGGGLGPVFFR